MKAAAAKLARKSSRTRRHKISTTIAPETYAYLQQLMKAGEAEGVGSAVDYAIAEIHRLENRERLARDTMLQFANMTPEQLAEERELEQAIANASRGVNFDQSTDSTPRGHLESEPRRASRSALGGHRLAE